MLVAGFGVLLCVGCLDVIFTIETSFIANKCQSLGNKLTGIYKNLCILAQCCLLNAVDR